MELLKEINAKDLGIGQAEHFDAPYQLRKAARAVVINEKNQIGLLFVSKKNYHKLPGGGVKKDESLAAALKREVLEELGCDIQTQGEVGMIIEYRDFIDKLQISYCYFAKVVGQSREPEFTEKEIRDGFQIKWMNINDAIAIIEKDKPTGIEGKYIQTRDLAFLLEAKEEMGE